MSENILNIYGAMMRTAGLTVDEAGRVFEAVTDESKPPKAFKVKGKQLVMPTKDNLRNDTDKTIRFHPLMENVAAGESDVMTAYRREISIRLNYATFELVYDLLRLAADEASHKKVDPNYGEVLSLLSTAKESTFAEFEALFRHIIEHEEGRGLVKIFMKKNGKIGTQTYNRLGVVSFPLYEKLLVEEEPYGVKVGKRNRQLILKAFKYVFPDIDTPQAYSYGSISKVAPLLDALMGAVNRVYGAIAAKQNVFGQMDLDDLFTHQLTYSCDWLEAFGDIDELADERRLIPAQPGNEGNLPQDLNATKDVVAGRPAVVDIGGIQVAAPRSEPLVQVTTVAPTVAVAAAPNRPAAEPTLHEKRHSTFAEDMAAARQGSMTMQPAVQPGIQYQQAQQMMQMQRMQMMTNLANPMVMGNQPLHINPYQAQQVQQVMQPVNNPYQGNTSFGAPFAASGFNSSY